MKLKYCTDEFLQEFKTNFNRYAELYIYKDVEALNEIFSNPKNIKTSDIDFNFQPLKVEGGFKKNQSDNIKILFESLKELPVTLAIQEKLWVGLYNTYYQEHLLNYIDEIIVNEKASYSEEEKKEKIFKKIRGAVIFYRGRKRALMIQNLSSMWWIGYNLYDDDNVENPYWLLDFYLKNGEKDITGRSVIFLSSNLTNNKDIRLGIVEGIKELTEQNYIDYNRYYYSEVNKYFNTMGSVKVLDSMSRDEVKARTIEFIKENFIDEKNISIENKVEKKDIAKLDNLPYDKSDPLSIYKYSTGLINKTFNEIYQENIFIQDNKGSYEYENKKRKGGLGQLVEECYFYYECNNISEADFPEAGLELKVTPYKINKNGSLSSKERLILGMIDYFEVVNKDFMESKLWEKNKLLLMVFYLWEKQIKDRLDYRIDYVYLYHPPKDDLKIIIDDYNIIRKKIVEGKAHELSEGDTMYLGAATKASSSKDLTKQPKSDILAKPRAFSLKNSYMTFILRNYVTGNIETGEKILKDLTILDEEKISFEEYILNSINKNIGKTDFQLVKEYYGLNSKKEIEKKLKSSKSIFSDIAFRMLGVKSNKAEEFEKANIEVKALRLNKNGSIRESMSFPSINIRELIETEWDNSDLYKRFSETKYLFMIFQEQKKGKNTYKFKKGMFWNMPSDTIDNELKSDWKKIRDKFKIGVNLTPIVDKSGGIKVFNDLPKKKDLNILEMRSHAQKGYHKINGVVYTNSGKEDRDSDLLPNGDRITKQCFWLQNKYVESLIE